MSFRVTILRAPGKRLVKRFDADGRKHGYDNVAEFRIERREVGGFQAWCALLGEIEQETDRCVIRGAPGPWASLARPAYRLLHRQPAYADRRGRRVTHEEVIRAKRQAEIGVSLYPTTYLPMFVEEPTRWVLLDFEKIEFEPDWRRCLPETAAWLKLRLPDAFADISCWFQATGGAADPFKPDLGGAWVRMRLGFLLSRPLTQDQLEAWLGGIPGLDPVTFRVVQPIYVGRPILAAGLADPIPIRSGVLQGLEDVAQVPDDLPAPRPRTASWYTSADPLEGNGIGLLDCPELEDALAEVSGEGGKTRAGLGRAVWAYIHAVGRERVDVEALAARLVEEGLKHRSPAEVAGYGLASLVRWHLARAPDAEAGPTPHYQAEEAEAEDASTLLRQAVRQALDPSRSGPALQVGIKAAAGLGKSMAVLEELAAGPPREVRVLVPTSALGAELAAKARALGLNAEVIRGREAVVKGKPLCIKHEEAGIIAGAGLPVMPLLCRSKAKDGQELLCPFFFECRYLQQFRPATPGIRIFAHAYLFVPVPEEMSKPELIIIDEAFALGGARHTSFGFDRLAAQRFGMALEYEADIHDIALKVRNALERGEDPCCVGDAKSPSEKEPGTIKELKVPRMANDAEVSSNFPVTMAHFTAT